MTKYKQLRQLSADELLFNEQETRIILKFIFKPADHELIDSLPMDNYLKGFAQGLLVEAINASYAVGYVEAIFRSTANPTQGAVDVLKKFGREASKLWFKHASAHDLQDVKIYDFVRDHIALAFRSTLRNFLADVELGESPGAFIVYKMPTQGHIKVWG
ncbi:hypothetical protein SG34_018905 [Thalassomonas viridans]|uniref:Uncharacterized protein n=1 Tax=Thalassomonas viridans TaxID=137584 RepID=A0AAF0C7K9_9GAMM|nr:hypothetical protein [Thalassomonas viridans]WDE03451.1 hypothetical protein SG34_018905 [Thalassomonas viridans]